MNIKQVLLLTLSIPPTSCYSPPCMMINLDKGFNILETASKILPQGRIVGTAKEGWKFAWGRMMAELAPQDKTGSYKRPSYSFNGKIGDANFPDEAGRYHLYIGNPCPWCHRVKLALLLRSVAPSELSITTLVDDPVKASRGGWIVSRSFSPDPLNCFDLREVYDKLSPNYTGRCTAPLLIDVKQKRIVSNESADIVRMINSATFGSSTVERKNLYPKDLASTIDDTNEWVYQDLNNGVYRCGFATTQSAYDAASTDVRRGLERANNILSKRLFLCGDEITEADVRLLPTVLRYDGVYGPLFKAGGVHLKIRDYEHVMRWMKRCWGEKAVRESIDLEDACSSYWKQLFPLNAGGIVPKSVTAREIGLEE